MFDTLKRFPIIISSFDVQPGQLPNKPYKHGELRLRFKHESISNDGKQAECEVLLASLCVTRDWNPNQQILHEIQGTAQITRVNRTVEIRAKLPLSSRLTVDNISEIDNLLAADLPSRTRKRVTLKLTLTEDQAEGIPQQGPLKGNLFVRFGEKSLIFPHSHRDTTEDFSINATARLYKHRLEGKDSSGQVTGQFYLPVVPVPILLQNQETRTSIFNDQLSAAAKLWATTCNIHLLSENITPLRISQDIRYQVTEGNTDGLFESVTEQLSGNISGTPVLLVEHPFVPGGGRTSQKVSRNEIICMIDSPLVTNDLLLAHELGHAFGGDHDGRTIGGQWREKQSEKSIMLESGSFTVRNQGKVGPQAQNFASRWAFFREL